MTDNSEQLPDIPSSRTNDGASSESNKSVAACADEYNVGYKKPPKSGQFKPGQSGNPKGRKKEPVLVADQLRGILNKKVEVNEAGKTRKITLLEVMLRAFTNKAVKGDLPAAKFILDLQKTHDDGKQTSIETGLLNTDSTDLINAFIEQTNLGELSGSPGSDQVEETSNDRTAENLSQNPSATSHAHITSKGKQS